MTDVTVVGCTSCDNNRPAVVAGLCVQCARTALAERNALENRVDDLLHDIGVFAFAGIWVDGRDAESLRDPDTTELYVVLQNTRHEYLDLRDQRDAAQAAQAEMAQAELTLLAVARAVLASAEYDPDQVRVDPDALEVLETVCASYPALTATDATDANFRAGYLKVRAERAVLQRQIEAVVQAYQTLIARATYWLELADSGDTTQASARFVRGSTYLDAAELLRDALTLLVPTETPPDSPSPGLTVLGSPTAGLDTHLVCAQCERTRSVRLAHTVNHWPMCCGQPMAIAATRAEVLLLPENEEEIDYALEGHWPWEEGAE